MSRTKILIQFIRRRAVALCLLVAAVAVSWGQINISRSADGARPSAVGWRGDGTGRYPLAEPPLAWSSQAKQVRWKAQVGSSFSSPIVVGDRVFVSAEPNSLICVDRKCGEVLWKRSTSYGDLADPQATQLKLPKTSCGYTTPTPVSDGQRVAVVLGSGIVACYDLDGNRQWIRYLDCEQPPEYGRSASPLIVGDKLIVQVSHLIAIDLHTGQTIWQVLDATESYGSPIAFRFGTADLVATPEGHLVRADDGKVLATGLAKTSHVTPIYQCRRLFFIDLLAVACELSETAPGTITTRELWTQDLEDEFFASPVYHEELIYTVNNIGTLFVLDASTGRIVLQKDLDFPSPAVPGSDEPPPIPNFYPSLSLAGKSIFLGTDRGGALWLRPGRVYQEQGRIQLKEGAAATPVFSGRQMYLRSGKQLWCVED